MKKILFIFKILHVVCALNNENEVKINSNEQINIFGERRPSTKSTKSVTTLPSLPPFVTPEIIDAFEDFKAEFQTNIDINQIDGQNKLINFANTVIEVEKHNIKFERSEVSFALKVNSRAVLSLEEKRASMNGLVIQDQASEIIEIVEGRTEKKAQPLYPPAPDTFDYRNLGYVTEVVDQGFYCSSCYAYSAQAAIEGAIFKKYGKLVKLSDQAIIDCSKNNITANYGCRGGWMSAAFEYIIGNNGTEAAATYPLDSIENSCKFNATRTAAYLKSYGYIVGDEETLKRALAAIGPLSVGINGEHDSLYNYWKGVYDDPICTSNINHAVTLVGYGTDDSYSPPKDYWIIKNSWGTNWGENGYLRLARGKNMCGITTYILYPIV